MVLRHPSLVMAELAWRWGFGAAATALLSFAFLEYLDTLPVTGGDVFLLRTRHPVLVWQALAHILRGSAPRLVAALLVLALALSMAWTLIAALGRAATLKALLAHIPAERSDVPSFRLGSLLGLNFLRVAATVAAVVGCIGAMALGGLASTDKDPSPGFAFLVFLAVSVLSVLAWAALNWLLSLAAVFVLTEGQDAFGAISAAVDFCRARLGPIFASSSWFGLAHTVAFFIASSAVVFPLMFAGVLPWRLVLLGVLLVTLMYFAVADFLYMGRLASYVYIERNPEPEVVPDTPLPLAPPPVTVDRDELILGDILPAN